MRIKAGIEHENDCPYLGYSYDICTLNLDCVAGTLLKIECVAGVENNHYIEDDALKCLARNESSNNFFETLLLSLEARALLSKEYDIDYNTGHYD